MDEAGIEISNQTAALVNRLEETHRRGGLFEKSGFVSKSSDVSELIGSLAHAFAEDAKNHLKISSKVLVRCRILFNLAALVEITDWSTCRTHFFIVTTRGVYYAGYEQGDCA